MKRTLSALVLPLALLFQIGAVSAADIDVLMLNKSSDGSQPMVFEPNVIKIDVGDTVNWISSDRGHNVEFIKGAVPDGVEPFKSKLGKDVSYTFETPGVYVYKCTPHYGMGMIGMVVVGDDLSNLDDVKQVKYRGRSKKRAATMFEQM